MPGKGRAIRPRFEPDPADANDPRTQRDRLYAELRNISDLAEKLSYRVNRCAVRLAVLPIGDGDQTEGVKVKCAADPGGPLFRKALEDHRKKN